MANYRYINTSFPDSVISGVVRGHNPKVTVKLDPDTHQPDENGEIYYFKYDAEKEKTGNMQKRFATGFCSFLANRHGGNFVEDIPGTAIISGSQKESYSMKLDGVFSKSYKNDYHIYTTFTLDDVLKPQEGENFEYNNKHRVFASVENTMVRVKEYMKRKITEVMKNPKTSPFSPLSKLNDLEEDYLKIEEDLVAIVMLDYLFLNNDRHSENIEFSIVFDDNGNYHLVVSKIYDNDRTFGLDKTEKEIADSCSSKSKRDIYVNYKADVKYVIREKDCSDEFAMEMEFANNYHSDVIAGYIRSRCSNNQGQIDPKKLRENKLYKLFESYRRVDIKQEFYDYLCEVAGVPKINVSKFNPEAEKEFLDNFNRVVGASINMGHIQELTENFNIRRELLSRSMYSHNLHEQYASVGNRNVNIK